MSCCQKTHELRITTLGSQVTRQWINLTTGLEETDAGVIADLEASLAPASCGGNPVRVDEFCAVELCSRFGYPLISREPSVMGWRSGLESGDSCTGERLTLAGASFTINGGPSAGSGLVELIPGTATPDPDNGMNLIERRATFAENGVSVYSWALGNTPFTGTLARVFFPLNSGTDTLWTAGGNYNEQGSGAGDYQMNWRVLDVDGNILDSGALPLFPAPGGVTNQLITTPGLTCPGLYFYEVDGFLTSDPTTQVGFCRSFNECYYRATGNRYFKVCFDNGTIAWFDLDWNEVPDPSGTETVVPCDEVPDTDLIFGANCDDNIQQFQGTYSVQPQDHTYSVKICPEPKLEAVDGPCVQYSDGVNPTVYLFTTLIIDVNNNNQVVDVIYFNQLTGDEFPPDGLVPPFDEELLVPCDGSQPDIACTTECVLALVSGTGYLAGDTINVYTCYDVSAGPIGSGNEVFLYTGYFNVDQGNRIDTGDFDHTDPLQAGVCPDCTPDQTVDICNMPKVWSKEICYTAELPENTNIVVQAGQGWREIDWEGCNAGAAFTPFTTNPLALTNSPDNTQVYALTGGVGNVQNLEIADRAGTFISSVAVSGLAAGTVCQAITTHPTTGAIWALTQLGTNDFEFYTIDVNTGVFTLQGTADCRGGSPNFGFDILPDGRFVIGHQNIANTNSEIQFVDNVTYTCGPSIITGGVSGQGQFIIRTGAETFVKGGPEEIDTAATVVQTCPPATVGSPVDGFLDVPISAFSGFTKATRVYTCVTDNLGNVTVTTRDFDIDGNEITIPATAEVTECPSTEDRIVKTWTKELCFTAPVEDWTIVTQASTGFKVSDWTACTDTPSFTPFSTTPWALEGNADRTLVYALTGPSNDNITALETADAVTGALVTTVAVSGLPANMHISEMAIHPQTGEIWAIGKDGTSVFNLYTVDVNTGVFTLQDVTDCIAGANTFGLAILSDGRFVIGHQNAANNAAIIQFLDTSVSPYACGPVIADSGTGLPSGAGFYLIPTPSDTLIIGGGQEIDLTGTVINTCPFSLLGSPQDGYLNVPLNAGEEVRFTRVFTCITESDGSTTVTYTDVLQDGTGVVIPSGVEPEECAETASGDLYPYFYEACATVSGQEVEVRVFELRDVMGVVANRRMETADGTDVTDTATLIDCTVCCLSTNMRCDSYNGIWVDGTISADKGSIAGYDAVATDVGAPTGAPRNLYFRLSLVDINGSNPGEGTVISIPVPDADYRIALTTAINAALGFNAISYTPGPSGGSPSPRFQFEYNSAWSSYAIAIEEGLDDHAGGIQWTGQPGTWGVRLNAGVLEDGVGVDITNLPASTWNVTGNCIAI